MVMFPRDRLTVHIWYKDYLGAFEDMFLHQFSYAVLAETSITDTRPGEALSDQASLTVAQTNNG